MVQNWSEDIPGGAAETGAQKNFSCCGWTGQACNGTCKQLSSKRAYGQRELFFPELNSIIIKIVVLETWFFMDREACFGYY